MTQNDFYNLIWYIFSTLVLLPIGAGLTRWQSLNAREKGIVLFLLMIMSCDVMTASFSAMGRRNHFVYYYRTLSLLWMSEVFYGRRPGLGRLPYFLSGVVALMMGYEAQQVNLFTINTLTGTLAPMLLAAYAIDQLFRLINQPMQFSLRTHPDTYYHIGFLLLGTINAFYMAFADYFIKTEVTAYYIIYTSRVIFNAIIYVLFAWVLSRHLIAPKTSCSS